MTENQFFILTFHTGFPKHFIPHFELIVHLIASNGSELIMNANDIHHISIHFASFPAILMLIKGKMFISRKFNTFCSFVELFSFISHHFAEIPFYFWLIFCWNWLNQLSFNWRRELVGAFSSVLRARECLAHSGTSCQSLDIFQCIAKTMSAETQTRTISQRKQPKGLNDYFLRSVETNSIIGNDTNILSGTNTHTEDN